MATQTIPAANRAPGNYGPFGPFDLGANNSIDVQFNSSDWAAPGGTFEMRCDLSTDGGANYRANDFVGQWTTGGTDRSGNPNVPHARYDVPPNSKVRVNFVVGGRTINLGLVVTTEVKPAA